MSRENFVCSKCKGEASREESQAKYRKDRSELLATVKSKLTNAGLMTSAKIYMVMELETLLDDGGLHMDWCKIIGSLMYRLDDADVVGAEGYELLRKVIRGTVTRDV